MLGSACEEMEILDGSNSSLRQKIEGAHQFKKIFSDTEDGSCESCGIFLHCPEEKFFFLQLYARNLTTPTLQSLLDAMMQMRCPNEE